MDNISNKVRVIPLGGLGEVGKNMSVIEYGSDIIIVDTGVAFPDAEQFGIDLVLPDITYLKGKEDRIRGIVFTHGHEDHIGSLPYLWPSLRAPLYATALTLGLIQVKLREHGLIDQVPMNTVKSGDRVKLGAFEVEFIHVTHSIPDACALAIHTPEGTIVYTGDFKFDQSPVDGRPTDYAALTRLGTDGVLLLLSDCVHVETPGFTPSELEVGRALDDIVTKASGRVIISTFGSLLSRVQQVLDIGYNHGRKVALVGRSLENNSNMAIDIGYLEVPPDTLITVGEVKNYRDDRVILMTTGAQGEPMAALSRIANGDNRYITIVPGDTVVVSATPIPGNETAIGRIINSLFTQGASVIYPGLARVHVSGHASQEELKLMVNMTKPRFVAPVHGERRHQVLYSRMIAQIGVPAENIFMLDNGSVMEVSRDSCEITSTVTAGSVFVDGLSVGEIGNVVLRDRQLLARDGMLMVVLTIDKQNGEILSGPDIVTRGFVYMRDAEDLIERTKTRVREALSTSASGKDGHQQMSDGPFVSRKIREAVSEYLYQQTRRRPMILPVVMEL